MDPLPDGHLVHHYHVPVLAYRKDVVPSLSRALGVCTYISFPFSTEASPAYPKEGLFRISFSTCRVCFCSSISHKTAYTS